MEAKASTKAWIEDNYKMKVDTGEETIERLRTVHSLTEKAAPTTDKKDFDGSQLKMTELSLQTLTDKILAKLPGVHLGRKKVSRKEDGTPDKWAGQAFPDGSKTVVLYDSIFTNAEQSVFRGGVGGVNLTETLDITHELGHIIDFKTAGLREKFEKFIKDERIQPFTRYSIEYSEKPQEFFAEAFALSQTDPEWLKKNHRTVFDFFDTVNKTGKVQK
jgi:hypothetical protein